MNARSRVFLAPLLGVLIAGLVLNNSVLAVLSNSQEDGPIITWPSYAPNGREVAFWTTWRRGHQIWAVSAGDGTLRPLVAEPRVVQSEPAWSPTGSWIAFESDKAGNSDIWLVRSDGSGLTQLTSARTPEDQPAWSPDGVQIAFVSERAGVRNIWITNTDGSGLGRLTNRPCCQNHPSFSPDGGQIVFSQSVYSKVGAGSRYVGSHLWIINANGTGLRQLTTGPFEDTSPSWGARGILFESNRPGSSDIWMVQPDGSGLEPIPNVLGAKPAWSPDGTKFAFSDEGVYEFDFRSGAIRPLVQLKGYFITVDIMPGTRPNAISLKETGLIRVIIRSASGFDPVLDVNPISLTFGRTGDERSLTSCGPDGVNLVCHFRTAMTGFRTGDRIAILRAKHVNGDPLEGRGSIQVVP